MNDGTPMNLLPDEWERQNEYLKRIKAINDRYRAQTGRVKKSLVHTFGCQMNAHDSEKIEHLLTQMGYEKAGDEKEADLVLYNTCCIRENAENKIYGNLGFLKHLKESNPSLKVILCGCMMQQDAVIEKIKQSHRHVDLIFGTYNLHRFPELLHTSLEMDEPHASSLHGGRAASLIIDIWTEHKDAVEEIHHERKCKYKASVNIMYGCDNYCSYCIVPYVRGRERSRDEADIIREAEALARDGVKEITLLGQNVNSYGKGTGEADRFAKLLRRLDQIEGMERIRFMTSHPKDLSDSLIEAIRDCPSVCRHIHLPVQSGSTDVLRRMNRRYTQADYLRLVDKIKTQIPGILITTDIIVGFPGETEDDFQQTLEVVKKVRFSGVFTFLYSKRTGTPAAVMEDPVPEAVANERFQRLVVEINKILLEINEEQIGQVVSVLPEEINKNDSRLLTGRTGQNAIVHFPGEEEQLGQITDVKITGCKTFYLTGEPVS